MPIYKKATMQNTTDGVNLREQRAQRQESSVRGWAIPVHLWPPYLGVTTVGSNEPRLYLH